MFIKYLCSNKYDGGKKKREYNIFSSTENFTQLKVIAIL